MNEITAVIVGRSGSKRIPNKVIKSFSNTTLLELKIEQLQACGMVDRIIVGSDGDDILNIAKRAGAETVVRPDYFCDDLHITPPELSIDINVMNDFLVAQYLHRGEKK